MTVTAVAAAVSRGERTAQEVLAAHLAVVQDRNDDVNALCQVDAESAVAQARVVDDRVGTGHPVGRLAGVPVAVKDNVDVRGQVTSAGSAGRPPVSARRDATVVTRLRAAGAVVLGRANMDELAMGASTQTSAFGATRNPLDLRRSPGGSSGGSAAAVAAGMVPVALGSDTGGSIREPASQCGLVGVAPSHGLVPLRGVVPFAPGLDTVGPLTRTVADALLVTEVLAGRRLPSRLLDRPASGGRVRLGVPRELCGPRNQPGVLGLLESALELLRELGCTTVEVSLPTAPRALEIYVRLASVEALPTLRDQVQQEYAGAEVLRRRAYAEHLLRHAPADLERAAAGRERLREELRTALDEVDLLVCPTMPTTAPLLFGDRSPEELTDPLSRPYTDCWTVVTSLAGLPSLSVPMGLAAHDGMPAGLMVIARPGADGDLFALAARLTGEHPA